MSHDVLAAVLGAWMHQRIAPRGAVLAFSVLLVVSAGKLAL